MFTTKLDTSNLQRKTQVFAKAMGISVRDAMEYQGGLLCKDLVVRLAPGNLAKSQKKAEQDVRLQFFQNPVKPFPSRKRGGAGGITWLYAGKKNGRFLAGVDTADYQPSLDINQMRRVFYESAFRPGNRWKEIGTRGKKNPFHVMKLNRIVVARGKYRAFIKSIRERFGLLKASFGVGWDVLKVRGTIPAWVRKHIASGKAKGVLVNGLSNPNKPFLKFISRATGVEREESLKAIRAAVARRAGAINADLRQYIAGAKKAADFRAQRGFAQVKA